MCRLIAPRPAGELVRHRRRPRFTLFANILLVDWFQVNIYEER